MLSLLYYQSVEHDQKYTSEAAVPIHLLPESLAHCAVTNIVKCSTSKDGRSSPSRKMCLNCADKFVGEIEALRPRLLVSFTYKSFPNLREFLGYREEVEKEEGNWHLARRDSGFYLQLVHPAASDANRFTSYSSGLYAARCHMDSA